MAAATPAAAEKRDRVDRWSEYGRRGVGTVYRESGRRACGRVCGRAAERGGHYIYDRSRDFANRRGEQLQDFGRRTRERMRRRR